MLKGDNKDNFHIVYLNNWTGKARKRHTSQQKQQQQQYSNRIKKKKKSRPRN